MIRINDQLSIPAGELRYSASRSSGPGGQHVNKVSSRVTLHFDVAASPTLDEAQKQRLLARLPTRIDKRGVLRLHCQKHRSQAANKELLGERFGALLCEALHRPKRRRKTRRTRAAVERRLRQKKRRAQLKRDRSRRSADD